jgi:DeoR family transcriptional regulator, fructose operon transcriptional repressor
VFAEERKQQILAVLHRTHAVRVEDLGRALRASSASIRRDLADLERAGLLKRTHGGAVSSHVAALERSVLEKEDQHRPEKAAIAALAARGIEDGETIFLDAGSTTRQIACELRHRRGITVVTNALNIAWELASSELSIVLTGGQLRRGILSQVGPLAEQTIAALHVDKLFLAANAVHLEQGVTTPSLTEAQTKRAMVARATQVVLVADHSKFGHVSFARICGIERLHAVISDEGLAPEVVRAIEELGVQVSLAERPAP